MKKGVSVIIATYNGSKKLKNTLEHLARQKASISWEIVLVDNASTDDTGKIANEIWNELERTDIPFHLLYQPVPGKSYAQELGYDIARYEYLVVCDDDNWLSETYIQTAYEIMEENDRIGALGGWCEAAFEGEKPKWFDQFAYNYAVGKQGEQSGDITQLKGCLYGAGMVIRKSHWLELKEKGFTPLLSCRKGNTLSAGGDTEYSYALRLLGYRIWYDERLYFKHFMPADRLHMNYVRKLRKALIESEFLLTAYHDTLENIPVEKGIYDAKKKNYIRNYLPASIKWLVNGNKLLRQNALTHLRMIKRKMNGFQDYAASRQQIHAWSNISERKTVV